MSGAVMPCVMVVGNNSQPSSIALSVYNPESKRFQDVTLLVGDQTSEETQFGGFPQDVDRREASGTTIESASKGKDGATHQATEEWRKLAQYEETIMRLTGLDDDDDRNTSNNNSNSNNSNNSNNTSFKSVGHFPHQTFEDGKSETATVFPVVEMAEGKGGGLKILDKGLAVGAKPLIQPGSAALVVQENGGMGIDASGIAGQVVEVYTTEDGELRQVDCEPEVTELSVDSATEWQGGVAIAGQPGSGQIITNQLSAVPISTNNVPAQPAVSTPHQQQAAIWNAYLSGLCNGLGLAGQPGSGQQHQSGRLPASNMNSGPWQMSTGIPSISGLGAVVGSLQMGKKRQRTGDDVASAMMEHVKKGRRSRSMERVCMNCSTTSTPFWRKDKQTGRPLCNACGLYFTKNNTRRPASLWRSEN